MTQNGSVNDSPRRSTFTSKWGAVFATAGVAIGLGNIWRFPYMMGKYGGAAFLMAYLLIVVAFGIPALMTEWALGRHTRRGTWGAFQRAGLRGGRLWSSLLLLTVVMAASYYGVVIAWVLELLVAYGVMIPRHETTYDAVVLSTSAGRQLIFVIITVALGCVVLLFGVRRGIERISRAVLVLFFALFGALVWRSLTLEHATDGLREFLTPRWDHFTGPTALAALGQAFFSMGLGGTFMVTYGSYLRSEEDIPQTAIWTAVSDTVAAMMAGMIIFPAAFALGVPVDQGVRLMFQVLPAIFERMPAGTFFGAAFFLAVFLVAMLSLIAAYEVIVAALEDGWGWTRGRALALILVAEIALAVPAVLYESYIPTSDLIWGSTMQPVGGVIAIFALTWCVARVRVLQQFRENTRLPIPVWLFYWIKYGIPLGILTTLVYGWVAR